MYDKRLERNIVNKSYAFEKEKTKRKEKHYKSAKIN